MKSKRQEKIIEIIGAQDVETQEELTAQLAKAGFSATQATVSRDIREMKLTKVATADGRQKYSVMAGTSVDVLSKYQKVLATGIVSMDTAENIIVVKTVSGMAMAVAAALDNMEIPGLMGCIAGDDTIFCAAKNSPMAPEIVASIRKAAYQPQEG